MFVLKVSELQSNRREEDLDVFFKSWSQLESNRREEHLNLFKKIVLT